MATIGGITVDIMRGEPAGLVKRVEVWQVPGLDGTGAMILSRGHEGDELHLTRFGSAATITSWFTSIEGLGGQIVTLVDDRGNSHTNVLVLLVGPKRVSGAHLAGGTANAQRGERTVRVIKRS